MQWINTSLLIEKIKSSQGAELIVEHRIYDSLSDVFFITFDSNVKLLIIEVGSLRFCINEFEFKQQYINDYWKIL